MIYIPLFGVECQRCDSDTVVGIQNPSGVQSTGLCGPHFFQDRSMTDWEAWNDPKEDTE